ncbi:MAG: hypothetical protein RMK45_06485, partial [Armatimonadota bacterium]|nr:hypothetical protein [Armatimonadota bacterium]
GVLADEPNPCSVGVLADEPNPRSVGVPADEIRPRDANATKIGIPPTTSCRATEVALVQTKPAYAG